LSLGVNDYVIRQRLVQKMEYLANVTEPQVQASVEDFYEQNKDNYNIQSTITFTHVFINRENYESGNAAKQAASSRLKEMVLEGIDFSGAMQFGDRLAFHKTMWAGLKTSLRRISEKILHV